MPNRVAFRIGLCAMALAGACMASAQERFYSWTDDEGTTHYSNSMVPQENAARVETRVFREGPSSQGTERETNHIPFVSQNGDPTRRFVSVVLEGPSVTREVSMMVDTGAQLTMIDTDLAEQLGLERVQEATLTGVTGTAKGWVGELRGLRLGDEQLTDWPVVVGPQKGLRLLGMDVIEKLRLNVARDGLRPED